MYIQINAGPFAMEPEVTPEMIEVGYTMLLDAFNLDFHRSSPEEVRRIVAAVYQAMERERRAARHNRGSAMI